MKIIMENSTQEVETKSDVIPLDSHPVTRKLIDIVEDIMEQFIQAKYPTVNIPK